MSQLMELNRLHKAAILPWVAVIGPGAEGLNTNF